MLIIRDIELDSLEGVHLPIKLRAMYDTDTTVLTIQLPQVQYEQKKLRCITRNRIKEGMRYKTADQLMENVCMRMIEWVVEEQTSGREKSLQIAAFRALSLDFGIDFIFSQ